MRRLTFLIILLATVHLSANAQTVRPGVDSRDAEASRLETRPPAAIPLVMRTPLAGEANHSVSDDPLTEEMILARFGRLYTRQANILDAAATGSHDMVQAQLDGAMSELQELLAHPEIVERPRFRELYRTILTEYERYYGVPAESHSLPYGDIFAFRSDMFEVMNSVEEPLLENVSFPALGPVATTVPMSMNRLVEQSISYLVRSPEKHLYNWMSRAETYFPMIERVLREEGVPDELKYLAMIESGLNPRARSWAAANGMWQFISATGRAYDLQINSWVDERLDPEKATRAAARHLKDLHQHFGGDWQLALAGYNCSPARIKRAMARAERRLGRKATFWDIYTDIPRETRNYVPMFIAASLVASNPDAFDVDTDKVQPGPEYAYHYVPVRGFLSLDEIADMAGTSEAMIQALNPELRRSQIPPSKDAYYVRIPLGTYDRFADAYSQLPADKRQSTLSYMVQRGDVLGKIARRYGVSVTELMRTNGLRSTTIQVGQRLVVPVPSYDGSPVLADLDGEDVVTIEYGRTKIRPILADGASVRRASGTPIVKASTTRRTSTSRTGGDVRPESRDDTPDRHEEVEEEKAETRIVYTVRRGDNLTDIAKKYGVTVSNLRNWNGIRGSRIQVGQKIHLYESNPNKSAAQRVVYRVRRGDTLSEIASRYGVRTADLRRWNNLRTSTIRVGQRLTIHSGRQSGTITYRVQRGDSLYVIARKHGVTINELKRWNSLTSSKIRPGQELKINT